MDGSGFSSGGFEIDITAPPNAGAGGDACFAPIPARFIGNTYSINASTVGFSNDTGALCGPGGAAPDRVYSVALTQQSNLSITVASTTVGFSPAVYVRTGDCGLAREVGCADAPGATAQLNLTNLAPNTYLVVVDGESTQAGNYTLTITRN